MYYPIIIFGIYLKIKFISTIFYVFFVLCSVIYLLSCLNVKCLIIGHKEALTCIAKKGEMGPIQQNSLRCALEHSIKISHKHSSPQLLIDFIWTFWLSVSYLRLNFEKRKLLYILLLELKIFLKCSKFHWIYPDHFQKRQLDRRVLYIPDITGLFVDWNVQRRQTWFNWIDMTSKK